MSRFDKSTSTEYNPVQAIGKTLSIMYLPAMNVDRNSKYTFTWGLVPVTMSSKLAKEL